MMEYTLGRMRKRKATGIDGINMVLIKNGGTFLKLHLLQFMNMCWKQQMISTEWSTPQGIYLFKTGDTGDVIYREMSLFNVGYKIFVDNASNY